MTKTFSDAELNAAAAIGELRLSNEDTIDAPMFAPPPPAWVDSRHGFLAQQRQTIGDRALMNHYVELLARTTALMDFMQHNVGFGDEWPLAIMGDSEEVELYFEQLVSRVQSSVGCLTEA